MNRQRNKRIAGVVLWVLAVGVLLPIVLLHNGRLDSAWVFMLCMIMVALVFIGYLLVEMCIRDRAGETYRAGYHAGDGDV